MTVVSVLQAHKADSVPECPQSSLLAALGSSDQRLLVPEPKRLAVLSPNQNCQNETLLCEKKNGRITRMLSRDCCANLLGLRDDVL